MAVYGKDFYGLAKYGAPVTVDFKVDPVSAHPEGYGAIRVKWTAPSGAWTGLRLLKSRTGYAANEHDGEILLDQTTPASEYFDPHLIEGAWYYYTLFVQANGVWYAVGYASALSVKQTGYADRLWEQIPRYFHYVPRYADGEIKPYFVSAEVYDPSRTDQNNTHLAHFLDVLGWGLDYLRTYHETVLWANDTDNAHIANVEYLARTLGTEFDPEVPSRVMRSKVLNSAGLAKKRGTMEGLAELAALSTGWEVDLELGPNMFLNEDQSNFANPTFPEWDSATNYPATYIVQYAGRLWKAKTGGAYGYAQRPPDAPATTNTWWDVVTATAMETLRDPSTQGIVTWNINDTTNLSLTAASGVSSPQDNINPNSNALKVKNTSTTTKAVEIWGATSYPADPLGAVPPPPQPAVLQGLPIPHLLDWDASIEYSTGHMVVAGSRAFRAKRGNVGRHPDNYPNDWTQVGIDERPRLAFSFYSHADFDATPGAAVKPGVAFYDEHGNLIKDLLSYYSTAGFFDTFNASPQQTWDLRSADRSWASEKWVTQGGTWAVADDGDSRTAWPKSGTGLTTVVVPTTGSGGPGAIDLYEVAVTFKASPLLNKTQALLLRYADSSNYSLVTRTGVSKVVAGVTTSLATFTNSVKDGDRVIVVIKESTNQIWVYINGTQAAYLNNTVPQPSTTGSGGGARYTHGLAVI